MCTVFEKAGRWTEDAQGHPIDTAIHCGKRAIEIVQAIKHNLHVSTREQLLRDDCTIQDITQVMREYCREQMTAQSGSCVVNDDILARISDSHNCTPAGEYEIIMRYNCKQGEK